MNIRNGIDLVLISRMEEGFARHGVVFFERFCTPRELADCLVGSDFRFDSVAARFAAKEALAKALGTGIARGVSLREIEVVRSTGGSVSYSLSGGAMRVFEEMGFTGSSLSLSHEGEYAIASCVVW